MLTRNCTQRQFLLRPDEESVNAFIYCLAVAAQRYDVSIMNFMQMSNHLHDSLYDRHGNRPAFAEYFHKLLAKCTNARLGRWENVFASEQVNVVLLPTTEDLIKNLVYIATNPIKAGLVERVADWPGANGYEALLTRTPLHATRPKHFFAEDGVMPAEVTLWVGIPPELGDHDAICAEVRAQVEAYEQEAARRRAETGTKVLGRYAVLRQSWRETPTSRLPRRGERLRPTVTARRLWARLEALQRRREFLEDYRAARAALLAGTPIAFPRGTYWLRRFAGVAVVGDAGASEKTN